MVVANIVSYITAKLPPIIRFMTKQKFHIPVVKGTENAFDHMTLCFVSQTEELFQ